MTAVMTIAEYETYLALFMSSDPGWRRFYASDAVMEVPGPDGSTSLLDLEAIDAMFRGIHEIMSETAEVLAFVADEHSVSVRLRSSFVVKKDADYFGRQVRAGQHMQQEGEILYTMESGRIRLVRMGGTFEQSDFG